MPDTNNQTQHRFAPRTHVRVVREAFAGSDRREFPSMLFAYRELFGTPAELGYSEHQRMRARLRAGETIRDRHGFTWRSVGGTVAESTITWEDFTFGVELELTAPMTMYAMKDQLVAIGAGDWRVVGDGSVSVTPETSNHFGMEVVSPVLQGSAGLEKLTVVMDKLKALGCKVNRSCGMHVHVGVRGMKVERVRRIAIAFMNAERHFDALVPSSRRSNRYCQSNLAVLRQYDSVQGIWPTQARSVRSLKRSTAATAAGATTSTATTS